MKNIKLYNAHSIVDFPDYKDVTIHWLKYESKLENSHIENLIVNFNELDEFEKSMGEYIVNELFTESDCSLLENYLKQEHETELIMVEQSLPIDILVDGMLTYPLLDFCYSDNSIKLFTGERYNLPFKVIGYYDPEYCPLSE